MTDDPYSQPVRTLEGGEPLCNHNNIQTVEDAGGNMHTFCADCGLTVGILRDRLDTADAALQVIHSIADDLEVWAEGGNRRGFVLRQARRLREHVEKVDTALGIEQEGTDDK